jgi:hypothetical protein
MQELARWRLRSSLKHKSRPTYQTKPFLIEQAMSPWQPLAVPLSGILGSHPAVGAIVKTGGWHQDRETRNDKAIAI